MACNICDDHSRYYRSLYRNKLLQMGPRSDEIFVTKAQSLQTEQPGQKERKQGHTVRPTKHSQDCSRSCYARPGKGSDRCPLPCYTEDVETTAGSAVLGCAIAVAFWCSRRSVVNFTAASVPPISAASTRTMSRAVRRIVMANERMRRSRLSSHPGKGGASVKLRNRSPEFGGLVVRL